MNHVIDLVTQRQHAKSRPENRAVYTVAEVAELLDLSLGGTYNLIRMGEIPARRMGSRWVVPKERFHAWLNGDDLVQLDPESA